MQSTITLALLSVAVSAIQFADVNKTVDVKPTLEAVDKIGSESFGYSGCHDGCGCNDCCCHLDHCDLGAGTTGESEGGSYCYTAASNEQLPDKLYIVDAVHCRSEDSCGQEEYCRQDCGHRTFSIDGCITVAESFEESSNNHRSGSEKANGCAHKEQKIQLADNVPCPVDGPCVCSGCGCGY